MSSPPWLVGLPQRVGNLPWLVGDLPQRVTNLLRLASSHRQSR
ncbi:MAG: hypothetical protein WB535_17525 [Paenarthrobacter sp.]